MILNIKFIYLLLIMIILLILFLLSIFFLSRSEYISEKSDSGREYRVLPNCSKQSANTLDYLYLIYAKLQSYMCISSDEVTKKMGNKLKSRLKQENIMEMSDNNKSLGYTKDKGRIVKIKVKQDIKLNFMVYIFLHELAHVMSDSYGHNEEFNNNFNIILNMAIEKGLYTSDDEQSGYICGNKICNYY